MPFIALWLGVVIFGLGAIFSLLSAIRTMQKSRRWSDYRLRRRYVVQAQTSLVISFLLGSVAAAIFLFSQGGELPAAPAGPFPTVTSPATLTSAPTGTGAPTESPTAPADTPTATAFTATPIIPPTTAVTSTPALPIAVEALVEGTATPVYELDFGRLRFSTEISDYRLIAPGEAFHNPIKHMYAVFTYQPIGVKVQWTGLWYQNGELKYVDTTSWSNYPAGIGVVDWARDPSEWQAGDYELQIFVGTGWKMSGQFSLEGTPPTVTATLPPSATASPTLTFTASPTSTDTQTPTLTPTETSTAVPSNTPTATETRTPRPSPTLTPSKTATPIPSATNTATETHTPRPTFTPRPRILIPPSATPSQTASFTPSATFTLTPSATLTSTPLPTATRTATDTAAPPPTSTATATLTSTPPPTATLTASPTFTLTPSVTPTNTASATATWTPSLTATNTASPPPTRTSSPTASATPRPTFTFTPSVTPSPTITPTAPPITASVFFTSSIAGAGQTAPFNEPVTRQIPGSQDPLRGVLDAYFQGPTVDEEARGLIAVYDGYATYRRVELKDGIVSVYLAGNCRPSGTDYTIFVPLAATLRQFQDVQVVRIYDEYDHTREAVPNVDSWPACLDVRFTSTPTASATSTATASPTNTSTHTATPLPSATPTASNTPTASATNSITPSPTNTATLTPVPTSTPVPTATNTSSPTPTPVPSPTTTSLPTLTFTATYTVTPSLTPSITPSPTASPSNTPSRTPTITPSPTASDTPTNTFTPSATWTASPTLTLTPINAPTQTGLASATLVVTPGPSPTIDVACYHAEFLGDVTIFDNAALQPSEAFTKTWRVRNAGTCPWTSAYQLVFVRGDQMGGPSALPLPSLVVSNQTVDISVNLTAPPVAGQYQGFWQLRAPNGTTFGIGPAATGNLWVKIMVVGTAASPAGTPGPEALTQAASQMTLTAAAASPTSTAPGTLLPSPAPRVTANLAASACAAQWQGNDGLLDCPGQENDSRGYVLQVSQVALEDGTTAAGPALLTGPADAADGYILGLFPQIEVQDGDHFLARVGCQQNAPACSVLFRLSYLDTSGAAHDLWTLGEFYDGHLYDLDVDLSALAGQQIRPVLSVNNLGTSIDDRAVWIDPRIVHEQPAGPAPLATATASPAPATATTTSAPPTPTPEQPTITPSPTTTPVPPIPQFFNSVVNFFRQLFSGR